MLPVTRRCSDDRCSLLTQWTGSTASLKSCVSHNAVSSFVGELISTSAESDGGANRRCAATGRREVEHRDPCSGRRLDTTSSSTRFVDSDLSSRPSKNHSRKCEFAVPAVRQHHDYEGRRHVVGQSSLGRDPDGRSTSAGRRRRVHDVRHVHSTANNDEDDDDYITTSSEDENQPPASTSSFAPPNCVDDTASLLSNTTTSSSAEFTVPPPARSCRLSRPAEPPLKCSSRHCSASPMRRKSNGSSRSLTTSNDMDDDDNDLERRKSSEEIAVVLRGLTEARARKCQSHEDQVRAVKSLFEFRSSDELRIANDFIDGFWGLYSLRSLYNERYLCSKPASSTSLIQLHYSRSDKDFRSHVGCDAGVIVANDDRTSSVSDVTGSEQRPLGTAQKSDDVVDDGNRSRGLNVADVVMRYDDIDALNGWDCSLKEFRPLETIAELVDVTAAITNEDELTIRVRTSPNTVSDTPDNTRRQNTEVPDTEHRVPLLKPVITACDELQHSTVSDALTSMRQNQPVAVGEKSPGLTTMLSDWLTGGSGVRKLTEAVGVDSNSRFAGELIHVFDALLIQPGVGETESVTADIKMLQPLIDGADDWTRSERPGASKLLQADIDSVARVLAKTAEDKFEHLASTAVSGNERAGVNKNRSGRKKERESDIVWRLIPRLSVKPDPTCDVATIKLIDQPCNAKESNPELSTPKQPSSYDIGCMTATKSAKTGDFNNDLQSTGETRMRLPRRPKPRGRGKVRELIRLFESASASALGSGASPMDVKRATISAAVSVGELLRRSSEPEVTSCSQRACSMPDANDKHSRIPSQQSTEAISGDDIVYAPHLFGDESLSKPEVPVVVHKSTARWPTMSRIRRKHSRRPVYTTSVGDHHTASRIELDRFSATRNSTSDARTTPANNDSENLPHVDDVIRKTSETVQVTSTACVKMVNNNSSECQDASLINSANSSLSTRRPEAYACDCDIANVASTSKLSSPVVISGLPTVVDSVSSLSLAARPENVCHLPSSSSQRPLKSQHTRELAVTDSTLSPSVGVSGDRHEEGGPASGDANKEFAVHFNGKVHPSMKSTVRNRPVLLHSVGLHREQSTSEASPKSAAETTNRSTETSASPEVAQYHDCLRFDVRSWFTAGGPRLVEVPRWPLTSSKEVVAIAKRSKSRTRRPAKATLATETSCPMAYPLLRMTGVTVHLLNKDDVNNEHTGEDKETSSAEFTVAGGLPRTESTTKQSGPRNIKAVKHKSSRTVTKLTKGDEKLSERADSRRPNNVTVCSAAVSRTNGRNKEFDVNTSSNAALRGRCDIDMLSAQENHGRLERGCKSMNPNRRTTSNVTSGSDPCPVERRAPGDDKLSKRSSPRKQSDITSLTRTSSVTAKCGLVAPGESTRSAAGVTVAYSRRRSTSPGEVAAKTPSPLSNETRLTDSYRRLAQQFLLTSLLEYRLDARRK